MKCRLGFVSNSSSSSFVVIGNIGNCSNDLMSNIKEGTLFLGKKGTISFGWGPEVISDVFSRINFALIQSKYKPCWEQMLERVLKQTLGCENVISQLDEEKAYIDHQSSAVEGENTFIFDTDETLRKFLFCEDSKIVLNNDN
jgi:hypothetical protein